MAPFGFSTTAVGRAPRGLPATAATRRSISSIQRTALVLGLQQRRGVADLLPHLIEAARRTELDDRNRRPPEHADGDTGSERPRQHKVGIGGDDLLGKAMIDRHPPGKACNIRTRRTARQPGDRGDLLGSQGAAAVRRCTD